MNLFCTPYISQRELEREERNDIRCMIANVQLIVHRKTCHVFLLLVASWLQPSHAVSYDVDTPPKVVSLDLVSHLREDSSKEPHRISPLLSSNQDLSDCIRLIYRKFGKARYGLRQHIAFIPPTRRTGRSYVTTAFEAI